MSPGAIVGPVYAMGRPSRPEEEARAVRAAAAEHCRRNRSTKAVAAEVARRVITDALAYLDRDWEDPLIASLTELEERVGVTPVGTLARCPVINTAAEILELRVALYRARGCRQLTNQEREAETKEIAAVVGARLATRYARHLRK